MIQLRAVLCVGMLIPALLLAEGRSFVISSASLPPVTPGGSSAPTAPTEPGAEAPSEPASGEGEVINRLKQTVVLDYLKSALGNRFQDYVSKITPSFSEDYILDYKVSRKEAAAGTPNPIAAGTLELTGHLDVEGLNRWIRLNETKARGSASLRPVFLLSSEIPGLSFSPGASATTAKNSSLGQAFYSELSQVFRKFNTDLGLVADQSLLLTVPAESPAQIADLRDYAGGGSHNAVAWIHLQPCRSPGCGIRAEIHTYNLNQGRRLFVVAGNLKISVSELADSAKVQKAVEPLVKDYATKFEESVSKGTLFSTSYRLVVKNVDYYRSYKKLKTALSKLEYLVQATPKRVRANEVEFQVLSPVTGRELAQRLQMTSFPGFQLAATSADSSQVEVRFVNQAAN